jgi:hypothetical protein
METGRNVRIADKPSTSRWNCYVLQQIKFETAMPSSSNTIEFRDWYLGLTDSDRMIFLALASGQLTIYGRAFGLDLSGEQQIMAFKGLNEIQHQISFHIAGIAAKRERYHEDVFLQILSEKASSFGLSSHLRQSLDYARAHTIGKK